MIIDLALHNVTAPEGTCSAAAGMDQVGLRTTTPAGWTMLALAQAGLVAGTFQLAQGSSLVSKCAAGLMGLLAATIAAVSWRGGQQ